MDRRGIAWRIRIEAGSRGGKQYCGQCSQKSYRADRALSWFTLLPGPPALRDANSSFVGMDYLRTLIPAALPGPERVLRFITPGLPCCDNLPPSLRCRAAPSLP